jgi:hypothetical protein
MLQAARLCLVVLMFAVAPVRAATTVPDVVKMPGTQPVDNVNLDLNSACENCHHDGNSVVVNILRDWRGSMMSHAGRDPIFWATMAIAEQDFDGSGDLCLRCHTMAGWLAGQSTPTDGSALTDGNNNNYAGEGVGCEVCHKMTNPDNSEYIGVQNPPFVANDGGTPATGYYGSAQLSESSASERLGPYSDALAKHPKAQSLFHRSVDFCGSCHDVSNPVVGDLAHNNGAQLPLPAADQGTKFAGSALGQHAAFNYFPYQYGVVERTYSEYKAGLLSQTLVSAYGSLPPDLQAGAIKNAHDAAVLAGTGGNYADGAARYFSCQTCHMRATTAVGCNKPNVQTRTDQPMHDLTGGNYWMPDAIQYMDTQNTLLKSDNLTALENAGIAAGKLRAQDNLENAATLSVTGNTVKVVNLTGHKLISGYPEGRRMWLNIVWKDGSNNTVREDGAYGPLQPGFDVNKDGNVNAADTVDSLLNLNDPNTRVYEVHGAITQEWASQLVGLSSSYASVPVAYDRISGAVTETVGDIAAQAPGTSRETFHFVLNNTVVKDTRIPPYGMAYDAARVRNTLPVPETRYGNPGSGGTYNYFDQFALNPPPGAVTATINLMYQPTSWEYIEFLERANSGSVANLANEGANILDAWLNTGMAAPYVMETVPWTDTCTSNPDPLLQDTDNDGQGDACDADDDNDGLGDTSEQALGTDPLDTDTDNDGLSDYAEVYYNGLAGYQPGADTNPFVADTDGDGLTDGADPIPLLFNYADGDVVTDNQVNGADLLLTLQMLVGLRATDDHALAHVDLYPPGAPDGAITLSDYLLLLRLL